MAPGGNTLRPPRGGLHPPWGPFTFVCGRSNQDFLEFPKLPGNGAGMGRRKFGAGLERCPPGALSRAPRGSTPPKEHPLGGTCLEIPHGLFLFGFKRLRFGIKNHTLSSTTPPPLSPVFRGLRGTQPHRRVPWGCLGDPGWIAQSKIVPALGGWGES